MSKVDRFPYLKTTLVSFGFFTNNLTWSAFNVFVPFFLSVNLKGLLGEVPVINTLVALIMILDNVASILIQPAVGQLSDRTWIPKLGRRMPYVIIGLPLAAFFFGLIGSFSHLLFVLIIAICGFNISMAFYKSPVMSLVPDLLSKEYRSQGAGVLNVVGGVASISGLLLTSYLLEIDSPMAFWANSIIMIGCLAILLFSVREKKDIEIEKTEREKINLISAFKALFKEKNLALVFMLLSIFFHTAGYTIAETFISRYVTELLGFKENTAGYILGAFVGFSIIAALPAGFVGRRIGALNACLVGVIGFTAAIIPITILSLLPDLTIIRNILTLNIFTGNIFTWELPFYLLLVFVLGFSWLLLSINSIVVIWNLAPKQKIATYTSYFYLFAHLASVISPFLAGGIFDLYQFSSIKAGNPTSGLRIMFLYISVCFVITVACIVFVKIRRTKQLTTIKDKEVYIQQRLEQKEYPILYLPMLLFGVGVRSNKALTDLKKEQIDQRIELRKKIRKIRQNRRLLKKRFFSEIDNLTKLQIEELREHQQLAKEMKKDHKDRRKELRQEIMEGLIKKRLKEEISEEEEEEEETKE